mgnify:CR=1 FL=1
MINNKILLVNSEFPPQPGGIGNHGFHLANQLSKKQYEVEVLTDNRSVSGAEEHIFDTELAYKVHRVKVSPLRVFMYFKRIFLLMKLIRKNELIIASGKFSLWIVAFTSLFFKRKYIAIIHGSEVNLRNGFLKIVTDYSLHCFSEIIAVSNYTKSLISALNLCNVVVIPNAINENEWNEKLIKNDVLLGDPKLITVGNVTERKGQLNVIRQLPDLIKKYPKLEYHCVGIPTEKEQFLIKSKKLKVASHITFHGRVTDHKLKKLLKSSDIFVMLSGETNTGDVEGFGIAILEANALGIPVIGSKDCGIEDAIDDNKSGILISNLNTDEFLNAIKTIKKDYINYKKNARNWAMEHTWDRIIKKYIKIFEH